MSCAGFHSLPSKGLKEARCWIHRNNDGAESEKNNGSGLFAGDGWRVLIILGGGGGRWGGVLLVRF